MSKRHPIHDVLKAQPLFREFDDAELAQILEFAEPTLVPAGQHIVRQGDSGSAMFLLAEGAARAVIHDKEGSDLDMAHFHPGDFFGELGLVDHEPRSADVIAITDCMVLIITSGLLRMIAAESPRAAFKLVLAVLELVGKRLRTANRRYVDSLGIVSALASEGSVMKQNAL